jgi:molybdate transport system substrate-binding protein
LVKHPLLRGFAAVRRRLWIAAVAGLAASLAAVSAAPQPTSAKILVFAAASTTGAVGEITKIYTSRGLGEARAAFAASSALARQIAAGAPADVFISANPQWMDYLAGEHAIVANSRVDLLANQLVLIAPADSPLRTRIEPGFPLAEKLEGGRLAIGDPTHVPAGIYARKALEGLGVWPALAGRLAPMPDVRAVLAFVERGEVAAGIVYASDIVGAPDVRAIATFPADSHPPIVYPISIVAGHDRPEVRRFVAFLTSAEAAAIFRRYGFETLFGPPRPADGNG